MLQGPPGDMGVSGQSGKPGEKVRPVFNCTLCVCVCVCVFVCVCVRAYMCVIQSILQHISVSSTCIHSI